MKIDRFKGSSTFYGGAEIGQKVYELMKAKGLSEIEEYVLLGYLQLRMPHDLKAVGEKASEKLLKETAKAIMLKFPKEIEYPPLEDRPSS